MDEDRIALPDGLDWDTVHAAVQVIEDWELRGDCSPVDLVVRLYELFAGRVPLTDEDVLPSSQCKRSEHAFEYVRPFPSSRGEVAICTRCRCRFTAFPGTIHYDEIVAARERAKSNT